MTSSKQRLSAKWTDETDQIFIELCMNEASKGNRPGSSLSREGWRNVVKDFNSRTGSQLDQKQLKNRWDQLKKDWILYKNLLHGLTGIGWDPVNNTIDANNECWEEQIKVNPKYRKFRNKDLTLVACKADELFGDTVATGDRARASTQRSAVGLNEDNLDFPFPSNVDCEENDNAEGSGNSDDGLPTQNASGRRQRDLFPSSTYQTGNSSGSKRKRSGASFIKEGIQSLLNIAITKNNEISSYSLLSGPTIEECMSRLNELECIEKYTSFYYFSQSLFEKSGNRKIFMAQIDDRARVGWLEFKYADYERRNLSL